jgi:hypothetical protein
LSARLLENVDQSEGVPTDVMQVKHDGFTQVLPTHSSLPAAVSMSSQMSDGRAVISVLPESTRSNLAQLVSERSQLYSEMANVLGQETTVMHARSASLRESAEVATLRMRIAILQDEMVKHGIPVPASVEKGATAVNKEHNDTDALVLVAEGSTDPYTENLPELTEEEARESDRLQAEYAAEAAALEDSESSLMEALQV